MGTTHCLLKDSRCCGHPTGDDIAGELIDQQNDGPVDLIDRWTNGCKAKSVDFQSLDSTEASTADLHGFSSSTLDGALESTDLPSKRGVSPLAAHSDVDHMGNSISMSSRSLCQTASPGSQTSCSSFGLPKLDCTSSTRVVISEDSSRFCGYTSKVDASGSPNSTEASRVAKLLAMQGPEGSARAWLHVVDMMDDYRILEAEESFHDLLITLEADPTLVMEMKHTGLYQDLLHRVAQYEAVGRRVLGFSDDNRSNNFDLVWQGPDGDQVYVHMLPGHRQADVKVVILIEAPLSACCCPAFETDLQPQWNKALIKPPEILGPRKRFHQVVRQLAGVLMFRLELIIEVFRVCNTKFGFLAEAIRSEFPAEEMGITIPPKDGWRTRRIAVDTSNLWMPCGGTSRGSILVQVTRIDLGFSLAPALAKKAVNTLAGGIVGNLKKQATMATQPGTLWSQRLHEDRYGQYAELAKVEAAAAKRRTVTTTTLPDHRIFMRSP